MKVIFPTDIHVPYHSEPALKLAMIIGEDFDPDLRIAGSDGLDFYKLSSFDKNPIRGKAITLQDEIELWQVMEREWKDATPNARVRYLLGNHEIRLRRYIWQKAPELYSLAGMSFDKVLGLTELGIDFENFDIETNNTEIAVDNLVIKHGTAARKYSGWSVKAELEKEFFSANVLIGHCHRAAHVYYTTRHGVIQGAEGFCLCDINPPYATGGVMNWQQGIVLATTDAENVTFESIPFIRQHGFLTAVWRGEEYLVKSEEI